MKKIINKWEGKSIKGIKLTKSGILMGAHLVGARKAKKFFNSNGKIDPVDGNVVHVSKYISMFSGYDVSKI